MNVDRNALPFFDALASETRLIIIELLGKKDMNIHELAMHLEMSSTIVTRHVKILESAGIIRCKNAPGKRGVQKVCHLIHNGVLLNFMHTRTFPTMTNFEIPIGSYVDWRIVPPCGMNFPRGNASRPPSIDDDERIFADHRRYEAGIIWLCHGYLEYAIPNYIRADQHLTELRIQLEICSEAPGYAMNWPSDISFCMNGMPLGMWTASGDFGDRPGACAPETYRGFVSQYGTLLQIVVNQEGTFIGIDRTSDTTVNDILAKDSRYFRFRIESPEDAVNPRGFNLFGKGFGDYGQHILLSVVTTDTAH